MVLGFKKKGPEGVGCYGKLPLHGDYLSHQSDSSEAKRLIAWLNEGYRLTSGKDSDEAAETRFVFPGRGKLVLFGAFWPSADASGTRRFPFALFGAAPAKRISPHGARIPMAITPAWSSMEDAFPGLREAPTADEIGSRLSRIPLPEFDASRDLRGAFSDSACKAEVSPGAMDVLFDLLRLTRAIAPGRKSDMPAFAIRLPLTMACDPEVETAAWLEVLAQRLGENALPGQCHIFLRPAWGESPGELFVFHRELKPEDLGFVLHPTNDYPYANVLGNPGDEAAKFHEWLAEKAGADPTLKETVEVALADWA